MWEYLKRLFTRKTPTQFAAEELREAERALLSAQTGREYADAQVVYNTQRIKRLRKVLASQPGDDSAVAA